MKKIASIWHNDVIVRNIEVDDFYPVIRLVKVNLINLDGLVVPANKPLKKVSCSSVLCLKDGIPFKSSLYPNIMRCDYIFENL